MISAEKAHWPVRVLCRALQVSKSGYYAWCQRGESTRAREDRRLGVKVREAHERSRRTYGSPRVHAELQAAGERVSRKRIGRLMRVQGLVGRDRRRFVRTTQRDAKDPPAPNLLQQDFTAQAPNERWVGDVTYLSTPRGWLYLAVVMDLYSRLIVGWALGDTNDRHLALEALDMAYDRRSPPEGLVHHTDRGSPYTSGEYRDRLLDMGTLCSMSSTGNCYDNAAMESWFGTFKAEASEHFESDNHARTEIFDYIECFYNSHRRHSTLDFLSPRDFERMAMKKGMEAA